MISLALTAFCYMKFKELRRDLDEACSDPSKVDIFTKKVLVQ